MNRGKEILKSVIAVFLLSSLLLPSAIELVHFSDGHEHQTCADSSVHFHEATPDCSVFHVQLNSFHYKFDVYTEPATIPLSKNSVALHAHVTVDSLICTNTQLRAPPVVS